MTIEDKIRDEKIQYYINRDSVDHYQSNRYQHYHQLKLINLNILQVNN